MRLALSLVGLGILAGSVLALRAFPQSTAAWRDPSPHRLRWMTVDSSVRLEVLDWGGSGRPVVLLGCYLTAHVYDDFAPKLTDGFHVYGITRRGIGASDKPSSGYTVQRSADDVLEVLDGLKLNKPILVGYSCGGQVLSMLGSQHSDRLGGLVYFDAADDPTLTNADYEVQFPDPAQLPPSIKPAPAPDYNSFEAYRRAQRRDHGVAFPEAELRQLFVANADGSVGASRLSPVIRRAIVEDSRVKPDYARIRVPVLAIYRRDPPFEEVAANFAPRNQQERGALRQQYAATRAMVTRWQRDLLAGVATARIVELPGANLYMFLSNEADVLREVRAFAATLAGR
ncbi:MAG: alpha/beta fold hydrolase [Bryobacteraceae bacterium]